MIQALEHQQQTAVLGMALDELVRPWRKLEAPLESAIGDLQAVDLASAESMGQRALGQDGKDIPLESQVDRGRTDSGQSHQEQEPSVVLDEFHGRLPDRVAGRLAGKPEELALELAGTFHCRER
ncbi:hypothetical protein BKK81_33700 (plasmid) [Cupriavidus sp. USMAHM13]|nr:hypothetical protein BKK81_33700 [Cupriavidus sp. USMAHM13]